MKCTRCGKVTDYYYMAGPVVLCEECACNSVATLADEGLFPFFDNVVTVQSGTGAASEDSAEEPVPAGLLDEISEVVNETMKKRKYMDPDKNLPEEPAPEEDGLPEEKFPEEFPEE